MENMKMKLSLLLLCFLLGLTIFTDSAAHASGSKSASISIPVANGLTGANNGAKTFYLDMPSGVSSSMINSATLKYNGNNSVVGTIAVENGKIKITLKGKESVEKLSNVQGFYKDYGTPYSTTPGNSIWLYSDGRRWQINDYKATTNTMDSYDVNATDGKIPSLDPPLRLITTQSILGIDGLSWYNNSAKMAIDSGSIIQSTVKVLEFSNDFFKRTPNIKGISFKNQRIIIDYFIPQASNSSFKTKWTPEQDDGHHDLSGHAEGRRYQVTGYYYYLADANVTTYSYGGLVTFDYNLPDEATLTGAAILEKPSPTPAKFEDKDVPVQINLKGELLAYKDSSNIEEWVFYAKEKGNDSTLKTLKDYSKTLTSAKKIDFTISKSKVKAPSITQEYELSVVVRFKKPVVTKTGTITSLKESYTVKAGVYTTPTPPGGDFPGPTSPPNPPRELKPPIALISAPKTIKAGQEFEASGAGSYDPDGFIKSYYWDTPNAIGELTDQPRGTLWYDKEHLGEQSLALTVLDDDSMAGSTSTEITVIEPVPNASIYAEGTLKQNRKVIIRSYSSSPTHYPLVDSKTKITITAVSGCTNADIKYSGSLNDVPSKDVLFKKPGRYKATIYVENTLGLSANSEVSFDIVPDEKPFAYFTLPGSAYRNPADGNQATISIDDMSYSPDKDIVARRLWEYRYDSNNNGNFADESWVIFSNENLDHLNFKVRDVGQYQVRLTVFEEFGQPTIDEFVTQDDRQSNNSDITQNAIERIFKVKNQAPDVDWSW
ncbi:hypothetical protein P40081_07260 [Paenibacillus sp. FSL P4-0081]|jgi:hypothetical protein|uniref:hypothetical protein n=1 Tax=Paenibacillus sp. FSL P4-0081 TaxID=1536769 RepID=UPI0004F87C54|nr:hypothetical protein [Paenibacillus sp. FSL P4-0081]AIQ28000.1 hypothetical protein P40081_07260 [Paenibacillus sp. FSL P4-0081]